MHIHVHIHTCPVHVHVHVQTCTCTYTHVHTQIHMLCTMCAYMDTTSADLQSQYLSPTLIYLKVCMYTVTYPTLMKHGFYMDMYITHVPHTFTCCYLIIHIPMYNYKAKHGLSQQIQHRCTYTTTRGKNLLYNFISKYWWTCKKYRNKAEMKHTRRLPYYGTIHVWQKKDRKATLQLLHIQQIYM